MTFYNIIFGILFLGTCRELFYAGFCSKWKDFFVLSTIALLVFNDTLFTTHEIEVLKLSYTVWMKLIDLLDFLILTAVIIILKPFNNFLGIKINKRPLIRYRDSVIWTLVTIYWLLGLLWNKVGNIYSNEIGFRTEYSLFLLFFFILMTLASWFRWQIVVNFLRIIIMFIVFGYIILKAVIYN
jgi:hypothetical protein